MDKTTVVNLNHEPYDVYIGRPGRGKTEAEGVFGNPYHEQGREQNLRLFRIYFYKRLAEDKGFAKKVEKLRGKKLGCFCKPKDCHGDIIADYVNNQQKQ